jgi:hypothetical protein
MKTTGNTHCRTSSGPGPIYEKKEMPRRSANEKHKGWVLLFPLPQNISPYGENGVAVLMGVPMACLLMLKRLSGGGCSKQCAKRMTTTGKALNQNRLHRLPKTQIKRTDLNQAVHKMALTSMKKTPKAIMHNPILDPKSRPRRQKDTEPVTPVPIRESTIFLALSDQFLEAFVEIVRKISSTQPLQRHPQHV